MTVRRALSRAVDAYRLLTVAYVAVLVAADHHQYQRPVLGWALLGLMGTWSGLATLAYERVSRRVSLLLVADVAIAVGMVLATLAVQTQHHIDAGAPTLPAAWAAASVMACAVFGGP